MSRVVVVSAGLGVPSSTRLLADRIGAAIGAADASTQIESVELRTHAHALTDRLLTGFPSPELAAVIESVRRADALVMVTPVFSASYSGLFKIFVDVLEPGLLDGTPVLVAATAGTARHSLVLDHAMRPLFAYQRAVVVPTGVFAATDDFGDAGLDERIARAAGELVGLVAGRPGLRVVRDEFSDPTPFEERLRSLQS